MIEATACGPFPSAFVDTPSHSDDELVEPRRQMVEQQLRGRDIVDAEVLRAMQTVPRHRFVPSDVEAYAYLDRPLPIGHGVTISQPYIVALMTQLAAIERNDRVLDVGTGSGYQAAVLAELGADVWGIEIIEPLAALAAERLAELGYDRATIRTGDGYRGWPEHAPYDAIILAAAPPEVPTPLVEQLAVGGRLVLPVGSTQWDQSLVVVTRTRGGFDRRNVAPVAFVPMTGEARG